jgi:hypothetical protein
MSDTSPRLRHGEVIETSTLGFLAESDRLHQLPHLGELVRARISDEWEAYAVVAFGETGAIDSGRHAVRRGTPETTDQQIYSQHPELPHVLRTVFRSASVGYLGERGVRYDLPPLPVPLHYGVHPCTAEQTIGFTANPAYLSTLLAFRGEVDPEHLIAAHLRWVDEQLDDGHAWLGQACRLLARLMRRDYDRLVQILESVDPEI